MFDLIAFLRQWFGSLTSLRVGRGFKLSDIGDRSGRAIREAQEVEEAYKQYATSEHLDTMGDAGRLPTESVNESFFSRDNDLLDH
jgi:hypothetical protein